MNNLEMAMEEEKNYIKDKLSGKDSSLLERIKSYGYNNLKDYFIEKQDFIFSKISFNFIEEPMPNGVSEIFKMINSNKPGILFVDWEDTYVVCGNQGLEEFNQDYCKEHNITFFPLLTNGGTIVGSKGDFSFGVCVPVNIIHDFNFILNHVKDILQKYTTKIISINGNDILSDGKKICGSAVYKKDDVMMVIMHFSFTDWRDLISNICHTKKIGKEVDYVSFMTRTEFKQEVKKWLLKS